MIKVGLKLGPQMNQGYPKAAGKVVDYLELYGKVGFDYSSAKKFANTFVIHAPHFFEKVNFCDPGRKDINLEAISWAKKMADDFNAKKIIIHPEFHENEECSLEVLIDIISENFDQRFHLENMPWRQIGNKPFFCSTPGEVKRVISDTGVKFCLDFAHAAEYAAGEKISLETILKEFLELGPNHFHLSDSMLEKIYALEDGDEHMNLFDGSIDLELIKKILPENSWVTLETPQIIEKNIKEIKFLKS